MSLAVWSFDLKSAWRGVRGGGWASLATVAALALGIGASVTAASVAYGGLLRPLPFGDPARLVVLSKVFKTTALESGVPPAEFDQWRARLASMGQVAAAAGGQLTIRGDMPVEAHASYVLGAYFDVLGASPEAGRALSEADSSDVAVASHRFAVRLAADPAGVVGRTLTAGSRALRIVGVMPASFSAIRDDVDLWLPARGSDTVLIVGNQDARMYTMIVRLAPGRSRDDLAAAADAALTGIVSDTQRSNWRVAVKPLRDALVGDSRPVLLVFVAAASLVLLVACANAAMLLVNRAVMRTREVAVRLALGAGRGRLVRTAMLETAIIALAGAAGGGWLAAGASALVARQTGLGVPRFATIMSSTPLVLETAAAAVLVVLICGLAPLAGVGQPALTTSLRSGGSSGSVRSRRLRDALVIAQLATAIVLLTGSALLGRTLLTLSRQDLGLGAPDRVLALRVPIGQSASATDRTQQAERLDRMLAEARRLPGVLSAGIGSNLPPAAAQVIFTVRYTNGTVDSTAKTDVVAVSDGYLDALGARLLRGRLFQPSDLATSEPVAVISDLAMRHLRLTEAVVDQPLNMTLPSASGPRVKPRVVGIIRDIRYAGLDAPANGGVYVLWRQLPMPAAFLAVRTAGAPALLSADLTRVVRTIDPSLPLAPAQTLDDVIGDVLAPRRARFSLVGVCAVTAVLLGMVGLSGALVRSVVERQRELAIRAAVGAAPADLFGSILRYGLGLAGLGTLLGVPATLVAGRLASGILAGVTPYDPIAFGAALAIVFLTALIACGWPARRAAAADPILLLRSE